MTEKNVVQTIHDTLWDEMHEDDRVLVMGEDVGARGGVFRVTAGFTDEPIGGISPIRMGLAIRSSISTWAARRTRSSSPSEKTIRLSRPCALSMMGFMAVTASSMSCTCPPTTALRASPLFLKGTCRSSMPAFDARSSMRRWGDVPMPVDP